MNLKSQTVDMLMGIEHIEEPAILVAAGASAQPIPHTLLDRVGGCCFCLTEFGVHTSYSPG